MYEKMSTKEYNIYKDALDNLTNRDDKAKYMADLAAKYGPTNDDIMLLYRYHT